MTEDDFALLLQHLVSSARRSGLGEMSDRVLSDIQTDTPSPQRQVLSYLNALVAELRLGSNPTIRDIVADLNEVAVTEYGQPIDGLRIELSPADQVAHGIEHVDLGVTPDLSGIIEQFERLRNDLAESFEEN